MDQSTQRTNGVRNGSVPVPAPCLGHTVLNGQVCTEGNSVRRASDTRRYQQCTAGARRRWSTQFRRP